MEPNEHVPGQMTVDECIRVAETGLDGKAVPAPTETAKSRPLSAAEVVQRQLTKKGNHDGSHQRAGKPRRAAS